MSMEPCALAKTCLMDLRCADYQQCVVEREFRINGGVTEDAVAAAVAEVLAPVVDRVSAGASECMEGAPGLLGAHHDGCPCRKTGRHRVHRCEHGTEWWSDVPDPATTRAAVVEQFRTALLTGLDDLRRRGVHRQVDPGERRRPRTPGSAGGGTVIDHSATLRRISDEDGDRVVVEQADDVIWIAGVVLASASTPPRVAGGIERAGDLVWFGTPGEGMGRLTYRITGHHKDIFGTECTVAERVVE